MKGRLFLDVVVGQHETVLEPFDGRDEALVGRVEF